MVFIGGCTTDSAKIYDIPQNNDNQSPEDNIETTENSCKGITCDTNKKCVDGNCVLKTCGEMNGIICSASGKTVKLFNLKDQRMKQNTLRNFQEWGKRSVKK